MADIHIKTVVHANRLNRHLHKYFSTCPFKIFHVKHIQHKMNKHTHKPACVCETIKSKREFIPQEGWVVHQWRKEAWEAYSQHPVTPLQALSVQLHRNQENPFLQFTCSRKKNTTTTRRSKIHEFLRHHQQPTTQCPQHSFKNAPQSQFI